MELNESKTQLPVISEKVNGTGATTIVTTNAAIVQQKIHEEIFDRTPILSRMNSMECWDYTIELECLNGPQG